MPLRNYSLTCRSFSCMCIKTRNKTRSAFGRAHVPLTKVFRWLAVKKTILKQCVTVATGGKYVYLGFSRRDKIPRCSAYTISEKAIRFWHLDYNPDWAQKLISSSMSWHLSTRNISSKSMHAFLSNLANGQIDKWTRAKCTSFVGGTKHCNINYLQFILFQHLFYCTYVDCITELIRWVIHNMLGWNFKWISYLVEESLTSNKFSEFSIKKDKTLKT